MEPNDRFQSLNGKATPLTFLQCLIESNGYWAKKSIYKFWRKEDVEGEYNKNV